MEIKDFFMAGNGKSNIPPVWFTINPHNNQFVLVPPKEEKKKLNFGIIDYKGCLPIFWSRVAGVSHEGRELKIRRTAAILRKIPKSKTMAQLEFDPDNVFHENAIKVMISVVDDSWYDTGNMLVKPFHAGFIPKYLANFIRFAYNHGVIYTNNSDISINTSAKWVSIKLSNILPVYTSMIDDDMYESVRTPMIKKIITGSNLEDFRNALAKRRIKKG